MDMSKRESVVLASRTLSVLLMVWVFADMSYLPERWIEYVHYLRPESASEQVTYLRRYHLAMLVCSGVRILGFSILARWLYKAGGEVVELLLPSSQE
jgi:hypothetical protein